MDVLRIAAFADGLVGGNPAGVVLCEELPDTATMQAVAAEVGYSETVFAAPAGDRWRTRYFAPEVEVDFCGHATIALGAALALRHGDGIFPLELNNARITVEGRAAGATLTAALQSPPTRSCPADSALALGNRALLAAMRYDLDTGRVLALQEGIVTFSLIQADGPQRFHARNPFPIGGVYEDPATGAAAAALAGYLRDLGWPHAGVIEIIQGQDMGVPSRLWAEFSHEPGASIRVSGSARVIQPTMASL
jgi:predicted PhzF superfamily epimerase YddE/YHI9